MTELPKEIKEAVAYSAQNWPRILTAEQLIRELDTLARRVYILATGSYPTFSSNKPKKKN
jgi:hypothetical protein